MSYVDDNLGAKEQVLHRAYVSNAAVLLRPLIPVVVGLVVGLPIGVMFDAVAAGALVSGAFSLLFLSIPMLIDGLIAKVTTEVALTNQRVILKWGFIRRNTIETYLDKVESIAVEQSVIGRLFNYGSVAVKGTGGGGQSCPSIAMPREFSRAVNEHIQNVRSPGPSDQTVQPVAKAPVTPVVPTSSQTYFYSQDGADIGPHSLDEMRRLWKRGKLTDETLVFRDGDTEWQYATLFPEISFEQ